MRASPTLSGLVGRHHLPPPPPPGTFLCVCVWLGATGAPTDRRFSFGLWIDQPSMSTPHPPLLQHCRLCFPSRIRNIVQVVISDVRRGTRQLLPGGWTLFFWGGEGGHRTGTVARCFTFCFLPVFRFDERLDSRKMRPCSCVRLVSG